MARWWEPLRGDPMAWLLEDDDPSIAYFFLSEVLERPGHSLALNDARRRIRASPAVRAILDQQHPDGWWVTPDHLTEPRYTATLWQIYLLAELGMTGQDFRVATAADFVLETFMMPEGDFVLFPGGPAVRWRVPGLLLWSLHRLGYGNDERVRLASERLIARALAGQGPRGDADSRLWSWDSLPALWAMSVMRAQYASRDVQTVIDHGANLFMQDSLPAPPARALLLSFPNYDPCDVLFALRVLTNLDYGTDPRVRPALASVIQKQMEGGRWPLERAFRDAGLDQGEPGSANRWITLNVLRVLRQVYD